ncbi:MAG: YbaK/EbsC family protein [Anaerolineales bacterium]|nr:MAG: YbaK/EbsC family protein [Anaerolineales bacterium]
MDRPPASIALEKMGVPHTLFRHEGSVESFEQAARERNQRPAQVVRSILFRVTEDDYALVLVAGPEQISWKVLRKLLGRSRITMATEDEVLAVTGYRIGTVSPFGMAKQASPERSRRVRVMVEAGVLKEDEISIGSGVGNTAIIMKSADLLRALGDVEVVELFEKNS